MISHISHVGRNFVAEAVYPFVTPAVLTGLRKELKEKNWDGCWAATNGYRTIIVTQIDENRFEVKIESENEHQ